MQSDDLIGKLLSQSLTRSDERKPSFLLSCYSTSSCGYSNFMWVQNHLDKFTIENSIKGYLEEKKNPLQAWEDPKPQIAGGGGNTLGKFYKGSCPCSLSLGRHYRRSFKTCCWAEQTCGLTQHSQFYVQFPPFSCYCNTNTDHYSQLSFSDSKSKQQSCVHFVEEINTTN